MLALSMVVIASMIGLQGLGQPMLKAISDQYFTLGVFNGIAIVFITCDLDEALRLGDHTAIRPDGQIEQVGNGQQIVRQPANDHIASFVRDVNRGRVIRCRTLVCPGPAVAGPQVEDGLVIEEAER